MPKARKFKLHIHNHVAVPLTVSSGRAKSKKNRNLSVRSAIRALYALCFFIGAALLALAKNGARIAVLACFHTGNALYSSSKAVRGDYRKTRLQWKEKLRIILTPQYSRGLLVFALVSAVALGSFKSMQLIARGLELKNSIVGVSGKGSQYLVEASKSLQSQDISGAEFNFVRAYQTFQSGREQLDSTGHVINTLLDLYPPKRDADSLLKAASLISESGTHLTDVYKNLSGIKLTAEGFSAQQPVEEVFNSTGTSLKIAARNLRQASEEINKVNPKNLPKNQREVFLDLKEKMIIAEKAASNLLEIFDLLSNLSLGSKHILVMFENNNELRPTGGFMGTYGSLYVMNGKITKMKISSIYDLDGQLQEKILPPNPLMNVNDRWFLRDSNWFAHFPESAKKITSFYEKEGGETPDLVVAMTPSLILDMLKITGPVEMPGYNLVLDADNFIEQTQVSTSVDIGRGDSPKQVLADFMPTLLQKLAGLENNSWPVLLERLQQNLESKHIILYSRNQVLQKQIAGFGWAGEVHGTDRDYLSVVSSNLGGTKTDLYMDQEMKLKTEISGEGEIINELVITRTNRLPKLEMTHNTSFIRVFVPEGSVLLANSGFDYKNLDTNELKGYQSDSSVREWEKSTVKDMTSGTLIGKEAGKTFFGNWVTLQGGETRVIRLVYKLPFKLSKLDRHSLVLQKQMGTPGQKFDYALSYPARRMEWTNFEAQSLETSSLTASFELRKDNFLGIVLQKR